VNGATDALVIGAGPAGAATAILLARAGWQVVLVEQDAYPRRKVCGECIPAGTLAMLDELGIGEGVRAHAGAELRHIGWMSPSPTLVADFPPCTQGPYRYGRALSREHLDSLLVDRARALGVVVIQPAKARVIRGSPGAYHCTIDSGGRVPQRLQAAVVIDAHGSWQRGPGDTPGRRRATRRTQRPSDLFAFKAVFQDTRLEPGLLPVISLPGGYGGMVLADQGHTTLACCLRRDRLAACRALHRGLPAGEVVEILLRQSCTGVRESLQGAQRLGPWLTVGPLWPGVHPVAEDAVFRVGNAAGESHPLIGEGISMALQSATLLARELTRQSLAMTPGHAHELQGRYARAWQRAFAQRVHMAALYAHVAMRPWLAAPARRLSARWPALLTQAARLAGKASSGYAAISPGI
jgi:flavin-dependent dehydrogenase